MKHLWATKPLIGLAALLLLLQMGCSTGSTRLPPPAVVVSPPAQSQQPVPNTGGQTPAIPTPAGNPAVPADVQAMLAAVVQHYKAGRDRALQDFTNQVPPFNSDNLFVLCIGPDDKITALGGVPLFVGLSADQLSDNSGQFGQLLWLLASAEPKGSLPFVWVDPMSAQQQPKRMFYQKLSQDVCGVVANQP